MKNFWVDKSLASDLKEGKVVVMPTDTLYGIVGNALNRNTVERIYKLRKRNPEKPCIVLVSGLGELENLGINLSSNEKEVLRTFWPGPVSVVFDCNREDLAYLHRGTNTLAVRMPDKEDLRDLLSFSGPIIAPSANIEGMEPSRGTEEAKIYFGDGVDRYVDGGYISGKPSKVIRLQKDGSVSILRA